MIDAIEKARELYPDEAYIAGGAPQSIIDQAQEYLNFVFPSSYVDFLSGYGSFSFFGFEIYGILGSDFESSVITDAVRLTRFYRSRDMIDGNLLAIYDDNGDALHVLESSDLDSKVMLWDLQSKAILRTISPDFITYVQDRVDNAIQLLDEDGG